MSADKITTSCCASCGIAETDDVKLKKCTACYLVKYCCIECQKQHRRLHKKECRKRAAELRDEILFKQPESSHYGDCPICMIPLSLDVKKSMMQTCCSKVICKGCDHANEIREEEASLEPSCPFCRTPIPDTDEGCDKQRRKRIEANDPLALCQWGLKQYEKGDFTSSFEYCSKAAELGVIEAHYQLSRMYKEGYGVEKDEKKDIHHLEEAAIGGHPKARYNLGCHEYRCNGNTERAVKHLIIAASQGDNDSIKVLMGPLFSWVVKKEELAAALRAHHAAVDATKSPQREAAEAFDRIQDTIDVEDSN